MFISMSIGNKWISISEPFRSPGTLFHSVLLDAPISCWSIWYSCTTKHQLKPRRTRATRTFYLTSHKSSRLKSAPPFNCNLPGEAKNVFFRKMHDNSTESENPIETTGNNTPHKLTEILRWCGEIFTYCILYCRSENRMVDYEASGQGSSPDRKGSVFTPPSSWSSLIPFTLL